MKRRTRHLIAWATILACAAVAGVVGYFLPNLTPVTTPVILAVGMLLGHFLYHWAQDGKR